MKNVYRHSPSGDLYVIEQGELGRQVGLDGTRYLTMCPTRQVIDKQSDLALPSPYSEGAYPSLAGAHALNLVVTKVEFDRDFEAQPHLRNQYNSDIAALLTKYEAEGCDHSNVEWLVSSSLRLVDSMQDSQARCLLYSLAMLHQKKEVHD